MNEEAILINKVAESGLITLKLEDYYPKNEFIEFDLKGFLFRELILKEMDFRKALQDTDWSQYAGKVLCVYCSNDSIIPMWSYMLVAKHASEFVKDIYFGKKEAALISYYDHELRSVDWSVYLNSKIVIKGCSNLPVPASAYQTLTHLLLPYASSIMYGEPCSTVPIYKKKKTLNP
ncbi:MAG: DUF2480 family protein [Saprospiraceae bacterium]